MNKAILLVVFFLLNSNMILAAGMDDLSVNELQQIVANPSKTDSERLRANKILSKCYDVPLRPILEFAADLLQKKTTDLNVKMGALTLISKNSDYVDEHIIDRLDAKLTPITLELLSKTQDENAQYLLLNYLSYQNNLDEIQEKKNYQLLLKIAKNAKDKKLRVTALAMLFNNSKPQDQKNYALRALVQLANNKNCEVQAEAYLKLHSIIIFNHVLVPDLDSKVLKKSLFDLAVKLENVKYKTKILKNLTYCFDLNTERKNEIKNLLLNILENTEDERVKARILALLFSVQDFNKNPHKKVLNIAYTLMRQSKFYKCKNFVSNLWSVTAFRQEHEEELAKKYIDFALKCKGMCGLSSMMRILTQDTTLNEKYKIEIKKIFLQFLKECRVFYFSENIHIFLTTFPEFRANIIEVAPHMIDYIASSVDRYYMISHIRFLKDDPATYAKYGARLDALYFELINSIRSDLQSNDSKRKERAINISHYSFRDDILVEWLEASLDLLRNSQDDNVKSNILFTLWNDETIRDAHRAELVTASLDLLRQTQDENVKSSILSILWRDETIRDAHRAELVTAHLDRVRKTQDDDCRSSILFNLWYDEATRNAHRAELVTAYLDRLRKTQDDDIKSKILSTLWRDKATRDAHRAELVTVALGLLRNSQDDNVKSNILSILWNDETTRDAHRAELVTAHLDRVRKTQDENVKSNILSTLWRDTATRVAHRDELASAYLDLLRQTQDDDIKSKILSTLWRDKATRDAHRDELATVYLDRLRKTQDDNTKYIIVSMLWDDEATRDAHRDELVTAYLDLLRKTQGDHIKSIILDNLWNDKATRDAHRDELVTAYLDLLRKTQGDDCRSSILDNLWNDKATRDAHRAELVTAYLDLLRQTQDDDCRSSILSKLWNNFIINNSPNAELVTASVELMRNIQDENSKIIILYKLWSDEANRAVHSDKLIAYLLELAKSDICDSLYIDACGLLSSQDTVNHMVTHYFDDFAYIWNIQLNKAPANYELKLQAYIIFGDRFQDQFVDFITNHWPNLLPEMKSDTCEICIDKFGEDNPRVQELLLLFARNGDPRHDAISLYADLLQKLKQEVNHNPAVMTIDLPEAQKQLQFAINPAIFSYLPITQEAMATLDDVDAILGDDMPDVVRNVRYGEKYSARFTSYFQAPLTEEAMMLQAMIVRFKEMGDAGKARLHELMIDMYQCQQGKNQAIWDHYSVESLPCPNATLQNITDWLVRLLKAVDPIVSQADLLDTCKLSRQDLVKLIKHMLKKGHIFRQHMTDLQTKDADRLKALLGSIISIEQQSKDLGKELLVALKILKDLADPETFFTNLGKLCKINGIALPANKFGDQLSPQSLEQLILKLKASDIEGRGDLAASQAKLRNFVQDVKFIEKLDDYQNEIAAQFKELITGFVRNGWCVGLLNFMELANESGLDAAIGEFHQRTRLDNDMPLTWETLKTTVLRELAGLKRLGLNAIVENLTGMKHAHRPHDAWYVDALLGGVVGLRDGAKAPSFDIWHMTAASSTSKSLQEMLDLFHEELTPITIMQHLNQMIVDNQLSIIDPMSGLNIIWQMLSAAAKGQLAEMDIDPAAVDIDELLYNVDGKGATQLALALFLTKLGILQNVAE
jgi:hypothetical protein